MKGNQIPIKGSILFVLALLIIAACSRNPVTGKKELSLMSEKKELALGKQSDPSIVASFGLYTDDKMQKFLNEKGQQMAKVSHRAHLNYEFKLLDSPVVNAFAVPGGYVYFTRGIMAHFNNEAEFAGVLGHEIGHVTARHSAKQYSKQMLAQVGFIAGMIASPKFRQYANEASQSMQLLFLKFGRDDESQSDRLGVEYSTKIGYDSYHMANFFKTLNRLSGGDSGQRIPEFMSTHPDPLNRYENVHALTKEWQAKDGKSNYKVNRDSYLRMIDGMIYGEDPKAGYVEQNMFYHPELKFQFPVPPGWQTQNSPQQFVMQDPGGKGVMIFAAAQGTNPKDAATQFVTENKLTVVDQNPNLQVNGFNAYGVVADQVNAQDASQSLRIVTYFIQDGQMIWRMHGMAAKTDFASFQRTFKQSMDNYKRLTDQSKINKLPERIHIKKVQTTGTLSDVLRQNNMPSARFKELSIINGMELKDQVKAGTSIKVIGT